MFEPLTLALLVVAGLFAGTLVTLVARALPARGRLIGRPICAEQGCGLSWAAASQFARACGVQRACLTCGAGPARSDVFFELGTVGVFLALGLAWPPGLSLALHCAFATLLMVIFAIDLRHREVYLILGIGGIVLALLAAPVSMSGSWFSALVGGLIGALSFGGLYGLGRVMYRGGEPLGTGDITIAALLGAMAGFPGVFTALLVGIFAGGIGAAIILVTSRSRRVYMPYGPALCVGGLWAMLIR
jgi:prepilin signal peptidase PulO-like enzyme (type II secretory pathway)